MKKIMVLVITIFSLIFVLNISEAKKVVRKSSPCVNACQGQYRKCIQSAKKFKKAMQRQKIKECRKQRTACLKKCSVKKEAKTE